MDSIDELFSRDPEGYSTQDLDTIITSLLKQREIWRAASAAGAKRAPASPKAKGPAKPSVNDLSDLGLDE